MKIKRRDKILCYSEFRARALIRQCLMKNKPIKLYINTRLLGRAAGQCGSNYN